jgi:hypothetical protein
MSTAPSAEEFEQILQQLYQLSQAVLEKESVDFAMLQAFIQQRELLIQGIQEADLIQLEEPLQALIQKIQDADLKIEKLFQEILVTQGKELRQLVKGRQVLSGYSFPYTHSSSGVENQA